MEEVSNTGQVQYREGSPNVEGITCLMEAVHKDRQNVAMMLLEKSVNVNRCTEDDRLTALHYAAQEGHTDITKVLVEYGADRYITL